MECKTSELLEEELREENNVCNHFYSNGVNVGYNCDSVSPFSTRDEKIIHDIIKNRYSALKNLSK